MVQLQGFTPAVGQLWSIVNNQPSACPAEANSSTLTQAIGISVAYSVTYSNRPRRRDNDMNIYHLFCKAHKRAWSGVQIFVVIALMLVIGEPEAADGSAPSVDEFISLLRNSQQKYGGTIESAIEKVIDQADKENSIIQTNLGIALTKIKYYQGAVNVLLRATELDPGNAISYAYMGFASYWIDDCKRTLQAFGRAIYLAPENKEEWFWHEYSGRCYIHFKDYESAEAHCTISARLRPSDPRGQICLGKAQFNLKKYELATESFLKAYKMTTDNLYRAEASSGVLASLVRQNKLDSVNSLLGWPPGSRWNGIEIIELAESSAMILDRGSSWKY